MLMDTKEHTNRFKNFFVLKKIITSSESSAFPPLEIEDPN